MSKLRHDNIVSFLGCSLVNLNLMIVMEYVSGGSLFSVLQTFGSLPLSSVRRYGRDVLRGLTYLHERDVVHRDVKPQNVLVRVDGMCKLTDFGASAKVAQLQQEGALIGTPFYMSPEQCKGAVDKASDVWSFGIMLAELAMGVIPWPGIGDIAGTAFCYKLAHDNVMSPTFGDDMDSDVRKIVDRCVQRDPSLRPTCEELLKADFFLGED